MMGALKDGRYEIELDKTRHLLFDLNVIDSLNDKYGGYDKLGEILDGEKNPKYIKDLRYILTLLINEGADDGEPALTELQAGKLINSGNINRAVSSIYEAFNIGSTGGVPTDDEGPTKAATSTM